MPDTEKAYAALQEAQRIVKDAALKVAALGLEASKLSWDAKDGFDGAADELSNAESSLGTAMDLMDLESGEPDESAEHRKDYYSNLGVGRTAA